MSAQHKQPVFALSHIIPCSAVKLIVGLHNQFNSLLYRSCVASNSDLKENNNTIRDALAERDSCTRINRQAKPALQSLLALKILSCCLTGVCVDFTDVCYNSEVS